MDKTFEALFFLLTMLAVCFIWPFKKLCGGKILHYANLIWQTT